MPTFPPGLKPLMLGMKMAMAVAREIVPKKMAKIRRYGCSSCRRRKKVYPHMNGATKNMGRATPHQVRMMSALLAPYNPSKFATGRDDALLNPASNTL